MSETRAGFAALIGEPNAGKSTMMNALIGAKLSIVTHKVQTTRGRIRGVLSEGSSQIIFVDTPGLFAPRRMLDRAMVTAAWAGASEADVVLLLIEAHRGVTEGVERILAQLNEQIPPGTPVALVINKIDKVRRDALLALTAKMNERHPFERTFLVSATREDGLRQMIDWTTEKLPESPFLYPEDQLGDSNLREIAAEITREKLMLRLHQELPYQLTVETESWEEQPNGSVRIEQIVIVSKDGHRGIVLGKGGSTIKAVGQAAREEIAELIERPAHLFLRVKSDPKWLEDRDRYSAMGLERPNE